MFTSAETKTVAQSSATHPLSLLSGDSKLDKQFKINFPDIIKWINTLPTLSLKTEILNFIETAKADFERLTVFLITGFSYKHCEWGYPLIEKMLRDMIYICQLPWPEEHQEKLYFIIDEIEQAIKPIQEEIDATASSIETSRWQFQALHCQQNLLYEDEKTHNSFIAMLTSLNQESKLITKPSLFISYAWPSQKNNENEYWLQPFLKRLGLHLRQAGIRAILDIGGDSLDGFKSGSDIYKYVKQVQDSDFVLLICTESLLDEHPDAAGLKSISTQLDHNHEKVRRDKELGFKHILPILKNLFQHSL